MSPTRSKKLTKGHQAYTRLKQHIQQGSLSTEKPITEGRVSELLNVGRGPAREALLRLEAEGLIRSRGPHRTRYIRLTDELTPEEFAAQMEIREVLDGLAARRAALTLTGAEVNRLRQLFREAVAALKEGDRIRRFQALSGFTDLLRTGSGNPLIGVALEACGIRHLLGQSDETDASVRPRIYPDPELPSLAAVVDAIAAHDPDAAEARMRACLREWNTALLAWLEERHERQSDSKPAR